MSGPKAVMAEHGMDVPENIQVKVLENSDTTMHITIPMTPLSRNGTV